MVKMHGVLGPPLAHRPQGVDVAEHVGERHHRIDDPSIAAAIHPRHLAPTAVQVPDNVAHILLRGHHFDPHDRLEEPRPGLHDAVLEGGAGRDLKGKRARVDIVICAVEQYDSQIDNREAGEHASFARRPQPFLDPGHEFLGHGAADDRILKYEARARQLRLEAELNSGELTRSTGLLLVRVVDFGYLGDRLPIRDLWGADIGVHLELSLHPIDDDFKVQLAHALDHGLATLRIDG